MIKNLDDYFFQKKAIGQRFKIFRQLLLKSPEDIAEETNSTVDKIRMLEKGAFLPDTQFKEYFVHEYGLNLTWLLTGQENVFNKETPKTPEYLYQFCLETPYDSKDFKEFLETYTSNPGYEELCEYGD